jgi:RNA polymerase sigma factor (sigma-70 family)
VLGDEAGAEDVTQDVFARLWRHPARVDLERWCLRSYLGVIAHRRAVDALRRRTRRGKREERAGHGQLDEPSTEEAVVVTVVSSWRAAHVIDALERLPVEQQPAVRLAYYGGVVDLCRLAAQRTSVAQIDVRVEGDRPLADAVLASAPAFAMDEERPWKRHPTGAGASRS